MLGHVQLALAWVACLVLADLVLADLGPAGVEAGAELLAEGGVPELDLELEQWQGPIQDGEKGDPAEEDLYVALLGVWSVSSGLCHPWNVLG